jgi:hypothetical protein
MSKGEKPILSVRIDADLLKRVDKLAEEADVGRAEVVERCLALGIVNQEELVQWLKSPVKGPVAQLMSHPAILGFFLSLAGEQYDEITQKLRAGVIRKKKEAARARKPALE